MRATLALYASDAHEERKSSQPSGAQSAPVSSTQQLKNGRWQLEMTHFSHTYPTQQQASDAGWGHHHSQAQPYQQTSATPSWQASPQWQQSATQQKWATATGPPQSSAPVAAQAVVAPRFCAPVPTTFFVKDKLLSWSGGDVGILDQNGQPAFFVSGKVMSLRGSRVLKDAAGNPVCAMREKVVHCVGSTCVTV